MRTFLCVAFLMFALARLGSAVAALPYPIVGWERGKAAPPNQAESTAQPTAALSILFPRAGQVLQGKVTVQITITVASVRAAELLFAYQENPTDTWFLLWEAAAPPSLTSSLEVGASETATPSGFSLNPLLYEWDTTTITDGNYTLKLVVTLEDGSQTVAVVPNLRVRNYSPVETEIPEVAVTETATPLPVSDLMTGLTNTPLPQPTNPANLTPEQVERGLRQAALGVIVAFIGMGLYILLRSVLSRRS